MVLSPITHTPALKIEDIKSGIIIKKYREGTGIDVSAYFTDIPFIGIYECTETKYRFYYPIVAALPELYEELSVFSWYYSPWKWENDIALHYIAPHAQVLDIGCGNGDFLHRIHTDKNCKVAGLEFNDISIKNCLAKGIEVSALSIEDYSKDNAEKYDVVCAFQVLEHIDNPLSFIENAVKVLKPKGKLIIGVPNNTPYIFRFDMLHTLNLPPHHCGLWNRQSLRNVGAILGLSVIEAIEQKLTSINYASTFVNGLIQYKLLKGHTWYRFLDNRYCKLLMTLFSFIFKRNITSHTIVCIFEKA